MKLIPIYNTIKNHRSMYYFTALNICIFFNVSWKIFLNALIALQKYCTDDTESTKSRSRHFWTIFLTFFSWHAILLGQVPNVIVVHLATKIHVTNNLDT